MPLHVHCPTGCVIRMSSNRAGRIVRCPKCKSAIRIPDVDKVDLATGKPILCEARIARRLRLDSTLDLEGNQLPPTEASSGSPQVETTVSETLALESAEFSANQASLDAVPTDEEAVAIAARLPVPDLVKPVLRLRPILPELNELETEDLEPNEALTRLHATIEAPNVILDDPALAKIEEITRYRSEIFQDADGEASAAELELERQTRPEPERETELDPPTNSEVAEVAEAAPDPEIERNPMGEQVSTLAEGERTTQSNSSITSLEMLTPEVAHDPAELSEESSDDSKVESLESGLPTKVEEYSFLSSFAPMQIGQTDAIPVINLNDPIAEAFVATEETDWEQRLQSANMDRKVLARFFAICLCVVAIVNMAPALYHWYHWTRLAEQMPLPRWIYIQIFVGALHLVYAGFLFQVNDWSAMRAVSVAMLVVAFVFGFVSTGLLVGGGQGNLTSFLGIPYMLSRQACIWCVAMLCLATLMSYWGGKESSNWQRTDDLLKDILAKA